MMRDRPTYAFGLGFAVAAVFNGVLVIVKESSIGVREWMGALTGHHWLTHTLLTLAFFLIAGGAFLVLRRPGARLTAYIVLSTLISASLIAGSFLVT